MICVDTAHTDFSRFNRNIRAIKEDAEKWRDWNAWKRLANRSAIKIGLSRHGQNLSDCFQTFSVSHTFFSNLSIPLKATNYFLSSRYFFYLNDNSFKRYKRYSI